jgi:hypothetical protein
VLSGMQGVYEEGDEDSSGTYKDLTTKTLEEIS